MLVQHRVLEEQCTVFIVFPLFCPTYVCAFHDNKNCTHEVTTITLLRDGAQKSGLLDCIGIAYEVGCQANSLLLDLV
jgi:hypothetical protein